MATITETAPRRGFDGWRWSGRIFLALLLAVQNFNSFIIPWIMTGGGPAGSSDIWITHIYQLAFGRQRWGVGAAYAVLLFIIMMTLGYFYVKALTRGDAARQGA